MKVNLKIVRSQRRLSNLFRGILSDNPVLVGGMALPFLVVPAVSLQNGVALFCAMLLIHLPTVLVLFFLRKFLPDWSRVMVIPVVASLFLIVAYYGIQPLSPYISDSLGIYFSLLPACSMIFAGCSHMLEERKPALGKTLLRNLCNVIGFGLVACIVGGIREFFGTGTLWGRPMGLSGISSFQMAFAGFLLVGFLAVGARLLHRLVLRLGGGVPKKLLKEAAREVPKHD